MSSRVQASVYKNFIVYSRSPIVSLYGPQGLDSQVLCRDFSKRDRRLVLYRNFVRLLRFVKRPKFLRGEYFDYLKFRFIDDYNCRRNKLLGIDSSLDERELMSRAVNTLNFVNNAFCAPKSAPELNENFELRGRVGRSQEYLVLDSIMQYEASKLGSRVVEGLKIGVKSLKDANEYRITCKNLNIGKPVPQIQGEKWYSYISKLQEMPSSISSKKIAAFDFAKSILTFEKNLVLLNEDCKLLL